MLKRLRYLLLGAAAGFIVGIFPCFILWVILSNSEYAIDVLIGCVIVGAITSIKLGKEYELFFGYVIEFLTSEAWS